MHVAVVGSGISGISAAWHLLKSLKVAGIGENVRVSLFEASQRPGGWIQSDKVNGILLEMGPRTLRPSGDSGKATLEVVYSLGDELKAELIRIPKTSPAAQNRWIQTGDSLLSLPNAPVKLAMDMLRDGNLVFNRALLKAIIKERKLPAANLPDESLYDFLKRRFPTAPNVADLLATAMCHGIWSGDARKLSLRSNFPSVWRMERLGGGSVIRGAYKSTKTVNGPAFARQLAWSDDGMAQFVDSFKSDSIYTFKSGLEALPRAMLQDLMQYPNFSMHFGEGVQALDFSNSVSVTTPKSQYAFDHVISTIPSNALAPLLHGKLRKHLAAIPYSSVALTALAFPSPPATLLPVNGFGYLVPLMNTPNQPLGVVFDSCAVVGQDDGSVTRITVMAGGHSLAPPLSTMDAEGVTQNALDIVRAKPLSLPGIKPVAARSVVLKDCIPQYHVGHHTLLRHIHASLLASPYRGKLSLAGASYEGVSVNDCLKSGREVALALVERIKDATPLQERPVTGLDKIHS